MNNKANELMIGLKSLNDRLLTVNQQEIKYHHIKILTDYKPTSLLEIYNIKDNNGFVLICNNIEKFILKFKI
jgi:hypothetical protein